MLPPMLWAEIVIQTFKGYDLHLRTYPQPEFDIDTITLYSDEELENEIYTQCLHKRRN